MPPRDWRMRVEDMVEAISRVQRYVQDLTFEEFEQSQMVIDAVVRNFTIIGEAARRMPGEFERNYPEIPWKDMRDMRNVVVHEYFGVDPAILWQTATEDLPALAPHLEKLLTS